MKILLLIVLLFSFSSAHVFAGSASFGAYGKGYEVSGCNGIGNIVDNIEGYVVSEASDDYTTIRICEDFSYDSEDRVDTLTQIAKRAKEAGCFETLVDTENKTITVKFLDGLKTVTEVSSTTKTYQMEGFKPVVESSDRERVSNYCIINEESIEGSLTKFLK